MTQTTKKPMSTSTSIAILLCVALIAVVAYFGMVEVFTEDPCDDYHTELEYAALGCGTTSGG